MAGIVEKAIRCEQTEAETIERLKKLGEQFGVEPPALPRLAGHNIIDIKLALAQQTLMLVQFFGAIFDGLEQQAKEKTNVTRAKNK